MMLLKPISNRAQREFDSPMENGESRSRAINTGDEVETEEMCDKQKRSKSYYVYLLLCDDGSYYTGYTNNVASRLRQHKKGYGARYTRMRRPKRVIYVEEFKTRRTAMLREQQIKALTHNQKRDLERKTAKTRFKISHA